MTNPQQSCEEIADGIFRSAFLFVNYTSDKPTEKERQKYLEFLHKKFTQELEAKQKTIEELRSKMLSLEEALQQQSKKHEWQISEWKKEEVLWNEREKDYQKTIESLRAEVEALRNTVSNIQPDNMKLQRKMMGQKAQLSRLREALEKIADFEDDGIHPPREVCIAREALAPKESPNE